MNLFEFLTQLDEKLKKNKKKKWQEHCIEEQDKAVREDLIHILK